jgi:hypothetical protein
MYREISDCRLCESKSLVEALDLGMQALTGVFPKTRDVNIPAGPLKLVQCQHCKLVQLAHNYDLSLLYGQTYGYRSSLNQSMVRHLHGKVRRIEGLVELCAGDLVADIGSNDGTLLNAYTASGLRRIGIDPSGPKFYQFYKPGVELIPDFFSESALRRLTDQKAKVVTSIAMFYDLERPREFVRQIRNILADDGVWVFEQSYLPFMVSANSYDTICHEHLEYYALHQIVQLLDEVNMKIVDLEFNDVNGGSFSVSASHRHSALPEASDLVKKTLEQEEALGYTGIEPLISLRTETAKHREHVRDFLEGVRRRGETILGYGASTKGNVLLQYCNIDSGLLPAIAEVNEDKFGSVTPGTKISIISESEARQRRPDYFFVLPWHFRSGIVAKESDYLAGGGKLVFPLPRLDVVSAVTANRSGCAAV